MNPLTSLFQQANAASTPNLQSDPMQMIQMLGQANLQLQASNNAAALASQLSQCCCTTQRGIDSVNYNGAINTAAINKNIDDKFAALEKAGLERQIQEQAAKISALELASQMVGVVKYPMSYAYSAGASPFCGGAGCYATNV